MPPYLETLKISTQTQDRHSETHHALSIRIPRGWFTQPGPPCLPVDGCFGYGLVQQEERYCWTGRSLTADMMDGGAEIITGGKQINAGLLHSIFRFQTDKSAVAPLQHQVKASLPTER